MNMPAPVAGESYPMTGTDDVRTNYLSLGMTSIVSYNDNVFPGGNLQEQGEESYSVLPSIMLNQLTPRQHRVLNYTAGFVFFQPTTALNSVQQSANAMFQYRSSVRTTLSFSDNFQQSSNPFNQASTVPVIPISGSPEAPTVAVIAPFAEQYSNGGNVGVSYQYGKDGMIGVSGTTALLDYPNLSQVPGLNNFISGAGSAFFSRRLTGSQYLGGIYNYSYVMTNPVDSTTETQSISMFYTMYLNRTLSLSLSGGPQHYVATESGVSTSSAWTPQFTASLGWQRSHGSFAGQYNRTVTGGGGLIGTYESNSATGDATWQYSRTWILGASANYAKTTNATPIQFSSNSGGHSALGNVYLQHLIGQHLTAQLGYARLSQLYNGVSAVLNSPTSDRVFVSISYQLTRPLGR